jgi:hypothetical protein
MHIFSATIVFQQRNGVFYTVRAEMLYGGQLMRSELENIKELNLAVVKLTTVQVTKLLL